jgi:ATP/maltotriose-dependent transcriptional regulator MalT
VLRSKLRPPHPFRPLVRRTALRQRLDDAVAGAGVVLLLGPAGIGKTSLLAEWSADRDVSWVTIDAADNDPVRFCDGDRWVVRRMVIDNVWFTGRPDKIFVP